MPPGLVVEVYSFKAPKADTLSSYIDFQISHTHTHTQTPKSCQPGKMPAK